MTPLEVMIVDDEPLAQRRLQLLLAGMEGVRVAGIASGVTDAIRLLADGRPDVILLDIRMRDGSGFDLLQRLPDGIAPPAIVFVTAYDAHALQAFDNEAVDYLLKPVERARLARALERIRGQRHGQASAPQAAAPAPAYESEFWVRRNASGLIRIGVEQIDYATGEGDYVRLHLAQGSYLTSETLAGLVQRLDPRLFVRIHRSSIVRLAAVKEVRRSPLGALEVLMLSGARLRVGRVYTPALREMIRAA